MSLNNPFAIDKASLPHMKVLDDGEVRAVTPIMKYFAYQHLPAHLQVVSAKVHELANYMDKILPNGPEKTTGLRKLLEAKDCFVRAYLDTLPPKA